jgi:dienelactone hydrolase
VTQAAADQLVRFRASKPFVSKPIMLEAELFKPSGKGPFPAVVLMHGCGGWQPAVIASLHMHAMDLLSRGYLVLNVDSFGPRDRTGGSVCSSLSELTNAVSYRTADAFDAQRYLQSLSYVDAENIFLMGQSNGGSVALTAAKTHGAHPFRAVAAYYPWCGSFGSTNVNLASPTIIFGGNDDDWVHPLACRQNRSTGAELKLVLYPGAVHSFDVKISKQRFIGKLIGYDENATRDSSSKMIAFFDEKRHAVSKQASLTGQVPLAGKAPLMLQASLTPDLTK